MADTTNQSAPNKQKTLEQIALDRYTEMAFANLKKNIIQDLISNRNESVIYKKYPKERVVSFLERPQQNEKEIRELSCFLYQVSSHYRRLVDYYSSILLYNYVVVPTKLPLKPKKEEFKKSYMYVINECEKYNLKQECRKAIKIAVRDGVYFGLTYETEDSFYIRSLNPNYAEISSVEDGTFVPSIDLNYFSDKLELLPEYGKEIENAYYAYKGDKKKGTKGNPKKRWFEPSNGICIKADESDYVYSLPLFTGLLLDVFSIEDYSLLQKAKTEIDNYKVLAMKMDVDDEGIPKMDYDLAIKYYNQACANLPDGIGLILSPFSLDSFSFTSGATAERNAVTDAVDSFWQASGTSSLIFGSTKCTSSSALTLSVKPDEQIAFSMLEQLQRFFNKKIKKKNMPYTFKIDFLDQSIFNTDEQCNRFQKAAMYGVDGAKMKYASSIGLSPSDMVGMSYLENDILKLTEKVWNRPLVSSNTMSHSEGEGGRPTNASKGEGLTESGEQSLEDDVNANR